jgi:hypothetical protein
MKSEICVSGQHGPSHAKVATKAFNQRYPFVNLTPEITGTDMVQRNVLDQSGRAREWDIIYPSRDCIAVPAYLWKIDFCIWPSAVSHKFRGDDRSNRNIVALYPDHSRCP